MKLLFKQRIFSWLDSYDVYDESGNPMFTVKGELGWGHCLRILDAQNRPVALLKEVVLSLLPRFEIYVNETCIGTIRKEATFFKPKFTLDMNGWRVEGNCLEWDYRILDRAGRSVAEISKQPLNWSDTYTIDVADPADALSVLLIVLAIDAEKCSRD